MFDSVIEISKKDSELKELQATIEKLQFNLAQKESIDLETKRELNKTLEEFESSKKVSFKVIEDLNAEIMKKDESIKKLVQEIRAKTEQDDQQQSQIEAMEQLLQTKQAEEKRIQQELLELKRNEQTLNQ